jgi:hypothetical protein
MAVLPHCHALLLHPPAELTELDIQQGVRVRKRTADPRFGETIKHASSQAHKTNQNKSVILLYLLLCPSSPGWLHHESPAEEAKMAGERR